MDIFLISESKIDHTFTNASLSIDGYQTPYRKDRNSQGGGLVLYVSNQLICKKLDMVDLPDDVEIICVEVNLRQEKWLVIGVYKPPSQKTQYFLQHLNMILENSNHDNYIILGDFNLDERNLESLTLDFNLKNLVKLPTCYKNPLSPSCIDHIWVSDNKRFLQTYVIETGLSDHHKLTLTVLNSTIPKKEPRLIQYRSLKNFKASVFKNDLNEALANAKPGDFNEFDAEFKRVINKHMPVKKKFVRNNHSPFITKQARKEIMLRSRRKNEYNRNPTTDSWNAYRIQRNKCTRIIRDAKKNFYRRLDIKKIKDNKAFWKIVKPNFSEKACKDKITSLVENDEVIRDKSKIAETMNDYYVHITDSLDIKSIPKVPVDGADLCEISKIIKSFANHPSILSINQKFPREAREEMHFSHVTLKELKRLVNDLKSKKACPEGDIPVNILKENVDVYISFLQSAYNSSCDDSLFPDPLKVAEVSPLYKAKSRTDKANYRPISKLPSISKIFERIMFEQINGYMGTKLSPLLSGFRKGYSSQHALLNLINFIQRQLDKKKCAAALLMDLSKAFDCIDHELLVAKLYAYGFSLDAINYIWSYLSSRFQRVGIDGVFSSLQEILNGVPQGSILGPLLFNIFLNDFLFRYDEHLNATSDICVCNYADDNTFCASADNISEVKLKLEHHFNFAAKWFAQNGLQLNADKCSFIIFGKQPAYPESLILNGEVVENCALVKLLGVKLDSNLSFTEHIQMLYKRASAKANALKRLSFALDVSQQKVLFSSFISSEFNYCPQVWGFSSRSSIAKIDRLLSRTNPCKSEGSHESVHSNHCRLLLEEVYKTKSGLNPAYMENVFEFRENTGYCLRSEDTDTLNRPPVNTVKYGLQTIAYISALLWESLPNNVKLADCFEDFSKALKSSPNYMCKCRICADFFQNLGYL